MKEGEKPGKFLLPHGIILLDLDHIAFSWRVIPKAFRIKDPWESWNYQVSLPGEPTRQGDRMKAMKVFEI
jgi:hypothetical protein